MPAHDSASNRISAGNTLIVPALQPLITGARPLVIFNHAAKREYHLNE